MAAASTWGRAVRCTHALLSRQLVPQMPAFVIDDASLVACRSIVAVVARFVASGARAAVVGGVAYEGVGAAEVRDLTKARMRVLRLI